MEELFLRKDFRSTERKRKFGYNGETIKTKVDHRFTFGNCKTCRGACVFSNFYRKKSRQATFKSMFDPKYYRHEIHSFKAVGLLPRGQEVLRKASEIEHARELKNKKSRIVEALEYDPDSTDHLSRKLKAKHKRHQLEEDEERFRHETWTESSYSADDFIDTLKLFHMNGAGGAGKLRIHGCITEEYQESFAFVKKNQLRGTKHKAWTRGNWFYVSRTRKVGSAKHKKRALLQDALNDVVLKQNKDIPSDVLVKLLIGA